MWRRLIVSGVASALVFGGLALTGPVPAGATYSSPAPGLIETIAGTGTPGYSGDEGPAIDAELGGGGEIDVDRSTGNVVIADTQHSVVRVIAAVDCFCYGMEMTADAIYTIAGTGIAGYSGDLGPGPAGQLNHPTGLYVVPAGPYAGTVVIADSDNHRIRSVPMNDGIFFGFPYTAGHLYTVVGNGTQGFGGDGGFMGYAQLNTPGGVTADNFGNLVISDTGNHRLRVVAAATGSFYGQSMTELDIYTIAGNGTSGFSGDKGLATAAMLNNPRGVTVDSLGNIVFADYINTRVRVVAESSGTLYGPATMPGRIYTIAGNGDYGYGGDGIAGTASALFLPNDVAIDQYGNVVISDLLNERIRMLATTSNSYYGQLMTRPNIYTVAGNGLSGSDGDGGGAIDASVADPTGVTTDFAGNILIADNGSYRIRAMAQCGFSGDGVSALTISTTPSPDHLRPPQSITSQVTATVHNPSGSAETCITVSFTVDKGSLNSFYGFVDQGPGCTFQGVSGTNATKVDCLVNAIAPGADATASVAVQTTGVKAPDTITASVQAVSNVGLTAVDQTAIAIEAPVPGETEAFVPPAGHTSTDKATSPPAALAPAPRTVAPGATIIAKMVLPKYVRPNCEDEPLCPPSAAPVVLSSGALIVMERVPKTDAEWGSVLCPVPDDCLGDIMTVAPFGRYNDPGHPATLTLTWDSSVTGSGLSSTLYIDQPDNFPGEARVVPGCAPKVAGRYTNLPCFSAKKINLKGQLVITVRMLSANDPGFVRR